MNTWRMNGSLALAVSPSDRLSIGTVRQPRMLWPSDCTICSKRSSRRRRRVGIARQEDDAAAIGPGGRQGQARLAGGLLEEAHAASAAGRRRRRRCWPRCRWRRDGPGCAAPGWPAARSGAICAPLCRRRSRRRRHRAQTADRTGPVFPAAYAAHTCSLPTPFEHRCLAPAQSCLSYSRFPPFTQQAWEDLSTDILVAARSEPLTISPSARFSQTATAGRRVKPLARQIAFEYPSMAATRPQVPVVRLEYC